jgi:hypothetical protein
MHAPGVGDIVVTNPGGPSATLRGGSVYADDISGIDLPRVTR